MDLSDPLSHSLSTMYSTYVFVFDYTEDSLPFPFSTDPPVEAASKGKLKSIDPEGQVEEQSLLRHQANQKSSCQDQDADFDR